MFVRQRVRHSLYKRIFGYNTLCHFVQGSLSNNKIITIPIKKEEYNNTNLYASTIIRSKNLQRSQSRTSRNVFIPYTPFIPFLTSLNRYHEIQFLLIRRKWDVDRSECVIQIDGCWEDPIVDFDESCEFVADEIGEWRFGGLEYCKEISGWAMELERRSGVFT